MANTYKFLGLRCSPYSTDDASASRSGLIIDGARRSKLCHITVDGKEIGSQLRFVNSTSRAHAVAGCDNTRNFFPGYTNAYFDFGTGYSSEYGTSFGYDYDESQMVDVPAAYSDPVFKYTRSGSAVRCRGEVRIKDSHNTTTVYNTNVAYQAYTLTYRSAIGTSEFNFDLPSTVYVVSCRTCAFGDPQYIPNDYEYTYDGEKTKVFALAVTSMPTDAKNAIDSNNFDWWKGKDFYNVFSGLRFDVPQRAYLKKGTRTDQVTVTGDAQTLTDSSATVEGTLVPDTQPSIYETSSTVNFMDECALEDKNDRITFADLSNPVSPYNDYFEFYSDCSDAFCGNRDTDYSDPNDYHGSIKGQTTAGTEAYWDQWHFAAISACADGFNWWGMQVGGYADKIEILENRTLVGHILAGSFAGWSAQ